MGLFDRILNRRSLENPKHSLSSFFDVPSSHSGVPVTADNALEVSAVWAAVRVISGTMATLPLPTYRYTDSGREHARSHPLYRLLHTRPNPETTAFNFRETMQAHLLLYGNAFAEIERNGAGLPVALWPIHPALVRVERRAGKRFYIVAAGTEEVVLSADAMLHVQGFSLDGSLGLFPVHIARHSIGLAKAVEAFGASFFAHGTAPSGVLEHPAALGPESAARLKENWARTQSGLSNAQRVVVLEEGMKWNPMGVPPEHAQFLESRKFSVSEVARVFGIPPHLIGDLERATFSNIEAQGIEFVKFCIEPWARRWEQTLNTALFSDDTHYAEFNLEGLLRGDSASRAAFYSTLFSLGAISPNEIRQRENMNAVPGGDQRFVPMNLQSLESVPANAAAAEALRHLVDGEVLRYERRKEKQGECNEEWYERQEAILTENLGRSLPAYLQLMKSEETPEQFIRSVVRKHA